MRCSINLSGLTTELGLTHQAVKKVLRWSCASERSVKHWMAGAHATSGAQLVALLRHAYQVLRRLVIGAGCQDMLLAFDIAGLRAKLLDVLTTIDGRVRGAP